MPSADRRRASRVALEVPAAVTSRSGPILAEIRDVSVSGVKLFILAESLDLPSPPDLLEAAMAVKSALPSEFEVLLDYDRPREIERTATMARLVLPSYEPGCIELGCMFDAPLTPDELRRLCGQSPRIGESDRRSVPRVVKRDGPARSAPEERAADSDGAGSADTKSDDASTNRQKTYRVFITTGEEKQLLCHTTSIDEAGVQIRASDAAIGATDAAEAALMFTRRYGTDVSVKVTDGVRHVWTGPAKVLGLEISFARPGDLLISVAYGRELRPAERRRLGLVNERHVA